MSTERCLQAIRAAAPKITDDEITQIFERVDRRLKAEAAAGRIDNLTERVARIIADEAERDALSAAKARQHAARNAVARDRLDAALAGLIDDIRAHPSVFDHARGKLGLKQNPYRAALLALDEGTMRGVEGGRNSTASLKLAYEGRFLGDLLAAIQKERPHLLAWSGRALKDQRLSDDTIREMHELRAGGTPGATGNKDAQALARIFAEFAELARRDLNRLGATIGKLDGWAPHGHDSAKILGVSRADWIAEILPRLDLERSFGSADAPRAAAILDEIYDTITLGRDTSKSARATGDFQGPSNWADRISRERVLHMKTPEDWIEYNAKFGHGNIFAAMVMNQERAARYAAMMDRWGPNPEVMRGAVVEGLKKTARADPKLDQAQKAEVIKSLDGWGIESAWAEQTGMTLVPASERWAKIGAAARLVQMLSKLGGAVISSIGDTITAAQSLSFQGKPFLKAYGDQVHDLIADGRGTGKEREIALALHAGSQGLIDHIHMLHVAGDALPGRMSGLASKYFRLTGLTRWTDANRAVLGRALSAELAVRLDGEWQALPERYRHVLGLHGIGAAQWKALRLLARVEHDGVAYVTPDAVRALPDDALAALVTGKASPAKLNDARRELELAVRRFFADEMRTGVLETDAAARRFTTGGAQPGTFAGEVIRAMMLFKGYPIAFSQRVLGRALQGGEQSGIAGGAHLGTLLATMTVAGYISMTAKDALQGFTPRDPTHLNTWLETFKRAGVGGLYGDFLFGEANRFGSGMLGQAAGPVAGAAGDLGNLWSRAIRGDAKAGESFNFLLNNTPLVNVFYARWALDGLFLNSLRELASPGFVDRQIDRRRRDFGQERFLPARLLGG